MITAFRFNNRLPGLSYDFNTDIAPLHNFDVEVIDRSTTDRDKMQQHGVWPTYSYMGGMNIHVEGDLLADDTDDFVTKKIALINALRVDPNLPVTDRTTGTVAITFDGEAEAWTADVIMTAFTAPREQNQYAIVTFMITWFSWDPWFLGQFSGQKYYWN